MLEWIGATPKELVSNNAIRVMKTGSPPFILADDHSPASLISRNLPFGSRFGSPRITNRGGINQPGSIFSDIGAGERGFRQRFQDPSHHRPEPSSSRNIAWLAAISRSLVDSSAPIGDWSTPPPWGGKIREVPDDQAESDRNDV